MAGRGGAAQAGGAAQERVVEAVVEVAGPCCSLTAPAALLMARVTRLFFMTERQNLSRFLVTNLGITRYPVYK